MSRKKKINILMISSSAKLGGGTKHMFMLGNNLNDNFNVFYGLPKSIIFNKYLSIDNHLFIAERKIKFRDILNILNFINYKSIDIIHAHGKGAGVLSRIINIFLNKKLIYTFHGIHYELNNFFIKKLYIIYENLFGRIDSHKILVSQSEKKFAKSLSINLNKKFVVINNGVQNRKMINYSKVNEKSSVKNKICNVITICRLVKQKNVKEIVRIAELIPEINFTILGNGDLWNELNEFIFKKNINNVFFKGTKDDVFNYLYQSDIYLSTSLYEGLPISVLEAMSVGLPIIASNVIGNLDTIEDGKSGYLYDLNNINMAAKFIKILAQNIALRNKMGRHAFLRQRKLFSTHKMKNSYITLYSKYI